MAGVDPPADEEQLARTGGADDVDELADPRVRVDQAELRRRHAERDRRGCDPQIARDRKLEPTADRMAVERGDGRELECLDGVERGGKRMRDEPLGLVGEHRVGQIADVITG